MADVQKDELLTPIEAAQLLRVKPQTLAVWRTSGRYAVPFVRVGHLIRYRRSDLEKWLADQTVNGRVGE